MDRIFSGRIQAVIQHLRRTNPDRRVRIIDIGAGFDGFTARQIAAKYPDTEVLGIDLAEADFEPIPNYRHIRDDAINLEQYINPGTIDLIYSHEFFPHLQPSLPNVDDPQEIFERRRPFYDQIFTALHPEGVGLIQEMRNIWESEPALSYLHENLVDVVRFGKENSYTYRLSHQPVTEGIRSLIPQIPITRTY